MKTWQQAHKKGKVWVTVKINGGPVCFNGRPVGSMELKGPMDPEKAFILWLAANQLSPRDIQKKVKQLTGK